MKDILEDVMTDEGKIEEQDFVEFGEISTLTRGAGWGAWADPSGWPRPWP